MQQREPLCDRAEIYFGSHDSEICVSTTGSQVLQLGVETVHIVPAAVYGDWWIERAHDCERLK